jgi:hypothetical protein
MLQLLSIVDYQDNKDTFIGEFVELIYKQALVDLLGSLTANEQETVRKLVNEQKELDKAVTALLAGEWAQKYTLALALASKKMLEDYVIEINDTLTDSQKEMIELLFQTGREYLVMQ